MKKAILILIIIGFNNQAWANDVKQLSYENTEGYPYEQLINRVDSLKIIFSESENIITCSASMEYKNQEILSKPVKVLKNRFKVRPLKACLTTKQARSWLATTLS
jgi:hypothetical protein